MNIKELKAEFDELRQERRTWDSMYQILGKYISLIKQNFETTQTPGEFLLEDVFDATGMFAAHNAASALLGMLWPGTAKQTIEISPPSGMALDDDLLGFYNRMTTRSVSAMDDPKANLSLLLDEYMLDQMIIGTSGVGVERGYRSKLLYRPYGVKELYIEEGKDGSVSSIYLLYEWRVRRVISEYGEDKVSQKVREKHKNGKSGEKVKILIAIKPRKEFKAQAGALAMPYASLHIEYDTHHVLKESGFDEMPIMVGRFRKLNYERYGRSPASMALPDIREANALRESLIVATEKILNMPKGVLNDGIFGGTTIDMSAGAVNVFQSSGNVSNMPPIFDIGSPPNLPWAEQRLVKLEENIAQHFNVDRLLDFNNSQEMTFGEAQIRNQIRNQSLSSLFSRQISEVLTPLVERSIALLFRDGEFGVIRGSDEEKELLDAGATQIEYIPNALVERLEKGEDIYNIVYKTQAANASRAEEYLGIVDIMNFVMNAGNIDPSIADRVNMHEAIKHIVNIRGVPYGVLRSDEEVTAINQGKQEQQAVQEGMLLAREGAAAAKDLAVAQNAGKNQQ